MKAVVFDADGVLTVPEELFTRFYAKQKGLDNEPFEEFFQHNWQEIVTGKKDLKESINENLELWHWDGRVDELVDFWCKTEDIRNQDMLNLISKIKSSGIPCYLATDQEEYRGKYMKNVMFPGLFEHYFISSEIGFTKQEPEFFRIVLDKLKQDISGIKAEEIMFFDDSRAKVDTALSCGFDAHLFTSIDQVRDILGL